MDDDTLKKLRTNAEKKLNSVMHELSNMSDVDIGRLVHELQVHQIELEMQNDELKRTQLELEESNHLIKETLSKYSDLFEQAPVGYFTLDSDGRIIEANIKIATMLGTIELNHTAQNNTGDDDTNACPYHISADLINEKNESIIGKSFYDFINIDDKDAIFLHLRKIFETRADQASDIQLRRNDGILFSALVKSTMLHSMNNDVKHCRTTITDITKRVQHEHQIQDSLLEKEILLKEIHHRVKNNMQVIASLMSLQMDDITDEKSRRLLTNTSDRVNSMAMVHEKLYQSKDLGKIDFTDYIHELASDLIATYNIKSSNIRLDIDCNYVKLDINKSIPCALIINELVSNSLKYAFPGDSAGIITISLKQSTDTGYELSVSDNGTGLPETLNIKTVHTLGMTLVHALTDQLGGTLLIEKDGGIRFRIRFPA